MSQKLMGTPGELVSWRQTAKMLGVTTRTVANLSKQGMLKPVWKGRKRFYLRSDVTALLTIFNGKTDFASMANLAIRAFVKAEMVEKKLEELLNILGFSSHSLDTDEASVTAFYEQAKRGLRREHQTMPQQVMLLAKKLLALSEEFLRLVEQYTGEAEPWKVFLDLAHSTCMRAPRELFTYDYELASAYGYLDAARRHMRSLSYFYVRIQHGVETATRAFVGDNHLDPVMSVLYPNRSPN